MTSEPIGVCLAGATGWAGSELARAIASLSDVVLVAAVSRTHAGRRLGEVLGDERITCPIYSSAAEALASRCDVFVEYTKPDSAKANVLAAVEHGAHVVVGTGPAGRNAGAIHRLVAREREIVALIVGWLAKNGL